jgi:mitochondrial fission protein ELM1
LNRIAPERLAAAATQWQSRLADLPRPYTALLVGGNSSVYELDVKTATFLAQQSSTHVRNTGGSLLVSTSPRTPAAAAEALFAALDCPAYRYRWQPNDANNPYLGYLALADDFIVTVDSASQVVEACQMQKPVFVFEWPSRARTQFRVEGIFRRWLERYKYQPYDPSQSHHQRYSPDSTINWCTGDLSDQPASSSLPCIHCGGTAWLHVWGTSQCRHASRG